MPSDLDPVEFWITVSALLAGGGLVAVMAWIERRPRRDLEPRLLPTTPLLFLGAVIGLFALVHLLNLWGIHTGRNP